MANKKLTIKEIAKLSGVSPTAVSFVINGHPGVSAATRERVFSVIEMTSFAPNAASQRLTMKKSFNIALIYPRTASPFSDMFYTEVVSGFTEHITEAKYNVVFVPVKDATQVEVPDIIRRQDADGAVFLQSISTSLLDKLDELTFPYLLIDLHENDEKHTHVSLDCEQFICSAVKHLVQHGHTRIAFLGSDSLPSYYIRCFMGYQLGMAGASLSIQPEWIQTKANDPVQIGDCLEKLMNSPSPPTAVCCISDLTAIYAIQHAQKRGLRVPEELSFISIDDIFPSRFITPPLTSISYDKIGMGRTAGDLLLRKIAGEETQSHIIRDFTIVERASVAAAPYTSL